MAINESAAAQSTHGVTTFTPEMFVQAAPSNAYDMVQRLPGFTLVDTDSSVRGYGGARGNLLINGVHPASKQESLEDLLRRIPAGGIERIELIRNAPGVDMAGHAVVANVVRSGGGGQTVMEMNAGSDTRSNLQGGASLNHARAFGAQDFEINLVIQRDPRNHTGRGVIFTRIPGGGLIGRRDRELDRYEDSAGALVSWTSPLSGGQLALTGAARLERDVRDETFKISGASEPNERIHAREDYDEAEVGLRFNRAFGSTALETLLSHREGRLEAMDQRERDSGDQTFLERADTGETIARVDINLPWSDRLFLSAALEGAFNRLQGQAALEVDGALIPLPGSDVRIEEARADTSVGVTWRPSEDLTADAGLGLETSTIRQSGDSPLERDFVYLKPRASATWRPAPSHQLRASVSREVGQLDFEEFLASSSPNTTNISAGNASLEPDKNWRAEISWERDFWEDGVFRVTYAHERIDDAVDRIVIVDDNGVFDAPGNIGEGSRDTLRLDLSTSLDRWELGGFRVSGWGLWRASAVTDPVTAEERRISDEPFVEGGVELSRSLPAPNLNWGGRMDVARREVSYRFDEIIMRRDGVEMTAFVERRIGDRWLARAEVNTPLGRSMENVRLRADGPRSDFPISRIEHRRHERPGRFMLTLRREAAF